MQPVGDTFGAHLSHVDGHALVQVRGEVDVATKDQLWSVLEQAAEASPTVVVDLSGTTFMDASGLATLLRTLHRLERRQGSLVLRSPQPPVRRLLAFTEIDALVTVEEHAPDR